MSQHQTVFTIEKAIPAAEAAPEPARRPREFPVPAPEGAPRLTEMPPKRRPASGRCARLLFVGASLLAVAGAVDFGWQYWTVGRFEVSTDDAYVKADSTTIAPKVSGYIADVLVGDNEPVKAGQVLARIDDRDFKVALEQAKADVEAAQGQHRQQAGGARRPAIGDRRGQGDHRGRQGQRRPSPSRTTSATPSSRRRATAASRTRSRPPRASPPPAPPWHATPRRSPAQSSSSTCSRPSSRRRRRRSPAPRRSSDQAELNLSYTTIVAPVDGVVGNRTLRVGQYVQAGTQLMAVVPTAGRLHRRQLQGDAAHRCARRPAGRDRGRHVPRPGLPAATSTASRRRAARNSRCCRRTTPPATSPRSCSASR